VLLYGSLHQVAGDVDHFRVPDASGSCSIPVRFDEGRPSGDLTGPVDRQCPLCHTYVDMDVACSEDVEIWEASSPLLTRLKNEVT
jgi:hypothetical protein